MSVHGRFAVPGILIHRQEAKAALRPNPGRLFYFWNGVLQNRAAARLSAFSSSMVPARASPHFAKSPPVRPVHAGIGLSCWSVPGGHTLTGLGDALP